MGIPEHKLVMDELQREWQSNMLYHQEQYYARFTRDAPRDLCESQLSALVALLVKKGVLKPEK